MTSRFRQTHQPERAATSVTYCDPVPKGTRNIYFVERFPDSPLFLLIFVAMRFYWLCRIYFSVLHFSVSTSEFTEKLTERYRTER